MESARASDSTGSKSSKRLDVDGFAAHFRTAFRPLRLIAVGIVSDASVAEDVLQDAAIIALSKLDAFEVDTSFMAWFGTIVRNVALNRARKERRSRVSAMDPSVMYEMHDRSGTTDHPPDTDLGLRASTAGDADFDRALREALGEVPAVARACLLLRTLEGWDYARIAGVLGIPEGTAMSHVHRTRRRLRMLLASDSIPNAVEGGDRA